MVNFKKGSLFFSSAMIIYGSIGFFVQQINTSAINIVFFRCLFGAIFLGGYILLLDRTGFIQSLNKIKYIIGCSFFLVFNWVFLFSSFKYTSISVSISIYYLAPIFIMLYGILKLNEEKSNIKIIGMLIAFLGAGLASGITSFSPSNQDFYGVIFAFLAALFYACLVILAKNIKDVNPSHLAFLQMSIGIIFLLFFIDLQVEDIVKLRYDLLIMIGIVHTAIMYMLFFNGIKYSTMGMIALLGFIDPLIAVLIDSTILNTSLSYLQWIGVIFIMSSVLMKFASEGKLLISKGK